MYSILMNVKKRDISCYMLAFKGEHSIMKKTLVVLAVIALSSAAFAEPAKERGAYIGAGIAATSFDDGGAFAGFEFDDSDSGFGVFGGYKFLRYFAVEARYNDFGTFTLEGAGVDVTSVSVHAVGIIPFGTSGWELFGQLGLGTVTFDIGMGSEEDEDVGSAGLGVRFSWSRNFAVAAQLDAYAYEDTSLGTAYDVGVTSTMFSFQYIF
jgi:hypothetical protein